MNAPDMIPDSIGGADRVRYRNASDSPKVMRVSPFGGWESLRDSHQGKGFKGNVATEHGHRYEDIARKRAKDKLCLDLAGPVRVIRGDYAATLDDITISGETILEIKSPYQGKESKIWKAVCDYGDPSYYYWQMVHQMMVCPNAKRVILFVYDSKSEDYVWTEISRNQSDESDLMKEWDKFWSWKDTGEPDPADGWIERFDNPWDTAARQYCEIKKEHDEVTTRLDQAKKTLLDLADGDKTRGCGVSVVKSIRQGSVDYKKIPELASVDLDKYRGDSTDVWTVTTKKGKSA